MGTLFLCPPLKRYIFSPFLLPLRPVKLSARPQELAERNGKENVHNICDGKCFRERERGVCMKISGLNRSTSLFTFSINGSLFMTVYFPEMKLLITLITAVKTEPARVTALTHTWLTTWQVDEATLTHPIPTHPTPNPYQVCMVLEVVWIVECRLKKIFPTLSFSLL